MDFIKQIGCGDGDHHEINNQITFFPSLEELLIHDMAMLEEFMVLPSETFCCFPNLSILHISNCPKLGAIPSVPFALKDLSIEGVGFVSLPRFQGQEFNQSPPCLGRLTIKMCSNLISLEEGLMETHLPFLQMLTISNCEKLETLPGENIQSLLPFSIKKLTINSCGFLDKCVAKYLCNLTSLESLDISSCSHITSLPGEAFFHLNSLETLCIKECAELTSIGNPRDLFSLKHLEITKCPKLEVEPPLKTQNHVSQFNKIIVDNALILNGPLLSSLNALSELSIYNSTEESFSEIGALLAEKLASLEILRISNCANLKCLPEEIASLGCLKELLVDNCPEIKCLPVNGFPATLEKLEIWRSHPELKESCKIEVGSDWFKISNIPYAVIDWERNQ